MANVNLQTDLRARPHSGGSGRGRLAPVPQAQATWPEKPIKIVLPFGAGGVADVTARIMADKLSQKLGQRVVIENMPGPGGISAARA